MSFRLNQLMALFHPFYFITPPETSLGEQKDLKSKMETENTASHAAYLASDVHPSPPPQPDIRNRTPTPSHTGSLAKDAFHKLVRGYGFYFGKAITMWSYRY